MVRKRSLVAGRTNAERIVDAAKRKETFLAVYEEWGTIRKGCEAAGIDRTTYRRWHSEDFDFVRKYDSMRESFAESLETTALERVRNPDKGKGSDILLIFLLNGNMPEKYRPQLVMNEDSAKELIIEWRKAAKEMAKEIPGKDEDLSEDVKKTLTEILAKREGGKDTDGDKDV